MRTIPTLFATLLLLGAAACADDGQDVAAGDGSTTIADASPLGTPGGAEGGLFVSVTVGGGFVPFGFDFRSVPSATIYDDGRSLTPGAVAEIYPGPAVLPVVEGEVDEEQRQAILASAAEAGLLEGGADLGDPPITDVGTTAITVVVDGRRAITNVYALLEDLGPMPGLTDEQVEARERISAFVDLVSRTATGAESGEHVPDRYRVLPSAPGEATPDEAVEIDERDWPFPDLALVEGECVAVVGQGVEAFRAALADASELTRWRTAEGETYTLAVRPVLPHEPDCSPGR